MASCISAILTEAGLNIATGLAAAKCLYGTGFSEMISLKAMTSFTDGDLNHLPAETQKKLLQLVAAVDIRNLPHVTCKEGIA